MDIEGTASEIGAKIAGVAEGAAADVEQEAQKIVGVAGQGLTALDEGIAKLGSTAKAAFSTVETDALAVLGNLGHVLSSLDGFHFSQEVQAAKVNIQNAIISIAQHIGG